MHNLHLFALCLLSSITSSFAQNFGPDKPTRTISFTTSGIPTTTPGPKHHLRPGQRFAQPAHNPFYRPNALVYGPPKVAKLTNSTQPSSFNQTCLIGGDTVEERWGKHHYDVLHRNGTVQPVGFPLNIFKELELSNTTILSEITRAQHLVYIPGNHPNHTKRDSPDIRHSEKRVIIPPDERLEVFNTWPFPFSTVGLVGAGCTGTLIGPRHVLTAGHCVHSGGSSGKWFRDIDFTLTFRPGFNGTKISTRTFAWSQVWSVKGWTEDRDLDYDYALIILEDTETSFPRMSFGYNSNLDEGWVVNVRGFPGDKPENTMWHTDGVVTDETGNHFDTNYDTTPGNSGSAVYAFFPSDGSRIIYGIHSHAWEQRVRNFPDFWRTHTKIGNRATRINKARFKLICSWITPRIC